MFHAEHLRKMFRPERFVNISLYVQYCVKSLGLLEFHKTAHSREHVIAAQVSAQNRGANLGHPAGV